VTDEERAAAKSFSVGNFAIELASVASLTPAQIEAASARWLDTYRQAIAIVGDGPKVKDQVTPFGTVTVYTPEGEVKPSAQ